MSKDLSIKISVDSKDATSNVDKLSKGFENLKQKVDFGAHLAQLSAGLATLGAKFTSLVGKSLELADNFSMLKARVNLVSASNDEFIASMQTLFSISQNTASSFESTAGLYTSLKTATSNLSVSQRELLDVTKTINQTLLISGASASSSSAALIQLSQAFASGVLRGDELNSVLEQSPRLARAIAEGLGVSVGALRELGAEGKLSADEVFNALKNQGEVIDSEFSKMPLTIENARVKIQNSLLAMVGDLDSTSGASKGVANSLNLISVWIDNNRANIVEFGSDIYKSFELIGSALILVVNGVREGVLSMSAAVGDGVNNALSFVTSLIDSATSKLEGLINGINSFVGLSEVSLGKIGEVKIFNTDALKDEYSEVKKQNDMIFQSIKEQFNDIAKTSYNSAKKPLAPSQIKNIVTPTKQSTTPKRTISKKQANPQVQYKKALDKAIAYYDAIGDLENKRLKEKEKQSLKLKELGLNDLQISEYFAKEETKIKDEQNLEQLKSKERYYELLGEKVKASNTRLQIRALEMQKDGFSGQEISKALYGNENRKQNYDNLNSKMGFDTGISGSFMDKMFALNEFLETEKARIEAHYSSLEDLKVNHIAKENELDRMNMAYKMGIAGAGFDALGSLAMQFYKASDGKNRGALRAYQAMMVGKAIVNTYTAATNAYASAGNPILGAAMAAIAIAEGMAQVAMIKSQKFHFGGGVGLRSDEVNATLQTGEYVLSRKDVANLKDDRGTSGGVVIVNTLDRSVFDQWASSRDGKRVIKNVISDN
ncbi:tape measure protein [Campylobacter corcagiensis]|uniref:Tape measure protein n=1 Tax=Campylobacter corcagiensis TaxID=1448857 RepID=A0A7M1LG39_9BACT|nr:tape measure protein [Campylobacter corcagiensis]QKF64554.1 phage tail tape measure protein [Campylobacter corcagiensis]QOQ87271.1 tape measure protein [Campylobacter corcagiensis]